MGTLSIEKYVDCRDCACSIACRLINVAYDLELKILAAGESGGGSASVKPQMCSILSSSISQAAITHDMKQIVINLGIVLCAYCSTILFCMHVLQALF